MGPNQSPALLPPNRAEICDALGFFTKIVRTKVCIFLPSKANTLRAMTACFFTLKYINFTSQLNHLKHKDNYQTNNIGTVIALYWGKVPVMRSSISIFSIGSEDSE